MQRFIAARIPPMPPVLRRVVVLCFCLLLLGLIAHNIWQTLPPRVVLIETGPVGGSYHDSAMRYAKKLADAGLKTEIRANPQSLQIVDNLEKGEPRLDIGFSIQPLNRANYPNVASAGIVELQPLFIFYNIGLGKVSSLVNLRGKRLVMPPENSATAEIAKAVLRLYNITDKNTRFSHMPIGQAAQELKNGLHDAGFFMLAPGNQIVRGLLDVEHLFMLPLAESVGISRQLDHLTASVLPMSSYDLTQNLPDADLPVVGGLVNILVRKDINPAVMYALLDAMKDTHQGQSLVSAKGEFPSTVGTALQVHPLAAQWANSGTPWIFATFSPVWASLIDKYGLLALAILILAEVYRSLRYVYEFMELGATSTAMRILRFLDRRLSAGHQPGRMSHKMFGMAETIVTRESQDQKAKTLLEQLRPAMKQP